MAVAAFFAAPRPRAEGVAIPKERTEQIIALADFVALARTTPHRNAHSREIDTLVEPEGPSRLARQFGLLARSVAAVRGHAVVEREDLATTCRVGFDSLTLLRRELLATLGRVDSGTAVNTVAVQANLGLPPTTTKHHLEDAASVRGGLVTNLGKGRWRLSSEARRLLAILFPFNP